MGKSAVTGGSVGRLDGVRVSESSPFVALTPCSPARGMVVSYVGSLSLTFLAQSRPRPRALTRRA